MKADRGVANVAHVRRLAKIVDSNRLRSLGKSGTESVDHVVLLFSEIRITAFPEVDIVLLWWSGDHHQAPERECRRRNRHFDL